MTIYKALEEIQKTIKAPKNQRNNFGKYNYRSCEDIVEAFKKCAPDGCSLTLSDKILLVGERYYVEATARLLLGTDAIEVFAYAREPKEQKGMNEAQITGSASSYARKYALNGLFCLDDTKDADTGEVKNQEKKATVKDKAKQEAEEKAFKYDRAKTYLEKVKTDIMPEIKGLERLKSYSEAHKVNIALIAEYEDLYTEYNKLYNDKHAELAQGAE